MDWESASSTKFHFRFAFFFFRNGICLIWFSIVCVYFFGTTKPFYCRPKWRAPNRDCRWNSDNAFLCSGKKSACGFSLSLLMVDRRNNIISLLPQKIQLKVFVSFSIWIDRKAATTSRKWRKIWNVKTIEIARGSVGDKWVPVCRTLSFIYRFSSASERISVPVTRDNEISFIFAANMRDARCTERKKPFWKLENDASAWMSDVFWHIISGKWKFQNFRERMRTRTQRQTGKNSLSAETRTRRQITCECVKYSLVVKSQKRRRTWSKKDERKIVFEEQQSTLWRRLWQQHQREQQRQQSDARQTTTIIAFRVHKKLLKRCAPAQWNWRWNWMRTEANEWRNQTVKRREKQFRKFAF